MKYVLIIDHTNEIYTKYEILNKNICLSMKFNNGRYKIFVRDMSYRWDMHVWLEWMSWRDEVIQTAISIFSFSYHQKQIISTFK